MPPSTTAVFAAGGALAVGNIVLGHSAILAGLGRGTPWVRTAAAKIEVLFGKDGILREGSPRSLLAPGARARDLHLVDLGSGDGALIRAATRTGGYGRATGYELNPWLVRYSRLVSAGRPEERTLEVSLWEAALAEADVVLVYGVPPIMPRLGDALRAGLREGALVVANAYPLPSHALGPAVGTTFVETSRWSPDASSCLFAYRVPRRPGEDGGEREGGASRGTEGREAPVCGRSLDG